MDELEEGKQKFLEIVKGLDSTVEVVIPTTPSNSLFLISLTKGANRKFITVPEDDILDLPTEEDILSKTTTMLKEADRGILFRCPDNVAEEFPQFERTVEYDELLPNHPFLAFERPSGRYHTVDVLMIQ